MFRRTAALGVLFGAVSLLAACADMGGSTAQAPINLRASLSGAQEVPPVASPSTGSATLTYDAASKRLTWSVTWSPLNAPATMAHFHGPAAPGANAGVALPIGGAGMTSPANGQATLNDAQAADLLAGRWYINIHSSAHPGGEIRGQVTR
ncbi:MAG: CHRD domain-containing protein [Alphaproteobacteria bacterium]|nr:CHRD domain-containing protein [Alphaproteobacteria bacterium]